MRNWPAKERRSSAFHATDCSTTMGNNVQLRDLDKLFGPDVAFLLKNLYKKNDVFQYII